ncbi:P-loop containing nucleoside triphosphate hydrolase protein [Hypoxylon sp. FL1150]|nr:P-loop containing nucleoside triphosphate hydrolase protein [Hypoxylon sp. FL1150]
MNHIVVVDASGLLPCPGSTPKYWLDQEGRAWPDVHFQPDFSPALVTYFQYKATDTSKSIWSEITNSAGVLVEQLDTLHNVENSTILFLCHGLGTFIALRALSMLGSNWKFKCSKSNTVLVLFGTPLIYQNQNMFRKLLRACATTELGLPTKADNPTAEDLAILADVVKDAEGRKLEVVCVCEKQKSLLGRGAPSFLTGPAPRFSIGQQSMKMSGAEYVPVDQDHLNCARWNDTVYNHASALLKRHHPMNPTTYIGPTDINKDAEQVSVHVKSRPNHPIQLKSSSGAPILPPPLLEFPRNEFFVGRRDVLDHIENTLVRRDEEPSRPHAFALHAPPGYGKTQVARQFAEEHMGHFKSILWLFADSEIKILNGCAAHAVYLGLTKKGESADWAKEAKDVLWDWYRKTDRPWLVIFDNAMDQKLINDWWPHGPAGAILITTNDPTFATNNVAGDGAKLVEIERRL